MFDRRRHSSHAMWLALIAISTAACSPEPHRKRPVQEDPSKAPLVPEACAVRSIDYDCVDGLSAVAAGGMGGELGTSELEHSDCIVSQVLRMECPSYVSHFSLGRTTDGSLGIVAAQKGSDGLNASSSAYPDTRAHTHFYLFEDKLKSALTLQTPADGKQVSFVVAPGNQDHELDLITHAGEENAEPRLVWSPLLSKSSSISLPESGSQGFGLGAWRMGPQLITSLSMRCIIMASIKHHH